MEVRGLEQALEAVVGHGGAQAALLHIEAPGWSWSGAAGRATTSASFRVASIAKTFTAAAALQLVRQRRLSLDGTLPRYLAHQVFGRLRSVREGAEPITVRHLLSHTSGIPDFATRPEFAATLHSDPGRRWTAQELLDTVADLPSVGPPGKVFAYSDTGYVLLGLIIERQSGLDLAHAYRDLLDLDALGIGHTFLEGREPAPPGTPARLAQSFGGRELAGLDPSFDTFGGGGLVSTPQDLAHFFRALAHGRVLGRELTGAMLTTCHVTGFGERGERAGLGIFRTEIDGTTRIGHEGAWGGFAYHYPDLDLTVAGTVGAQPCDETLRRELMLAPARLLRKV